MQTGLEFLSLLSPEHLQSFIAMGVEKTLAPGATIVCADAPLEAVYLILDGLFGVYRADAGAEHVATIGAGEIVGEVSFLDDRPPSASVVALEPALVHSISRDRLHQRMRDDPAFAVDVYRAMAHTLSDRFRRVSNLAEPQRSDDDPAAWRRVAEPLAILKRALHEADQEASQNEDVVPAPLQAHVQDVFVQLSQALHAALGDDSGTPASVREQVGLRVRQEMLPYLLLTENAERFYSKPRGYAGDYASIERLYANEAGGSSRIGKLIDRCFLEMSSARAVRNRRPLVAGWIHEAVAACNGARPARVTSLACGPAREVFDVFAELRDPRALEVQLLDIDLQALAFVAERRDKRKLKRQITLLNENLIYLATGRRALAAQDQDLVYSIGLVDYFSDAFVVRLLDAIHAALAPGGRVVLGNFHPSNPDKALMDWVLDWKLIHRTEEDMHRLFRASAFGQPCTRILYEEGRVNLFAECVKAE